VNTAPSATPKTRIRIPVLMYHEIVPETVEAGPSYKMASSYYLSAPAFERQMRALAEHGYTSVDLDEAGALERDGKYVVITFDDGLAGNARHALPILKNYGFKAVFFVVAGSIGTPRYMSWDDLGELRDNHMSVQSHTMSHRSLLSLDEADVNHELCESKRLLEERLHRPVTSLSFPHGHFDRSTIRMACDNGYTVLCTSEVVRNDTASFRGTPVVLGRITVTGKMGLARFMRLVEFDSVEIMKEKFVKGSKNSVKRLIGVKNYGRLYSLLHNVKPSS
jgi:peptidoglycan/xylan/chitin deacetylase (PgdA/CDA1 family)